MTEENIEQLREKAIKQLEDLSVKLKDLTPEEQERFVANERVQEIFRNIRKIIEERI